MIFEWDDSKAEANLAKHQVAFEVVVEFEFETALVRVDGRRDYGEPRSIGYGFVGDRLHVLVFTTRSKTLRVISLRKANDREVRQYEDHRRAEE